MKFIGIKILNTNSINKDRRQSRACSHGESRGARTNKLKQASSFQVSASVKSANILLVKINYMTEPRVKGRGTTASLWWEGCGSLTVLYFSVMLLVSASVFLK